MSSLRTIDISLRKVQFTYWTCGHHLRFAGDSKTLFKESLRGETQETSLETRALVGARERRLRVINAILDSHGMRKPTGKMILGTKFETRNRHCERRLNTVEYTQQNCKLHQIAHIFIQEISKKIFGNKIISQNCKFRLCVFRSISPIKTFKFTIVKCFHRQIR